MTSPKWYPISDEALVEKLLPALQQKIADICAAHHAVSPMAEIPVAYADLSNVLLMLLATIMEPLPECATPQGTRLMADAAGKELAALIRDTRRLQSANTQDGSTTH